jgi:hypothetical protein
LRTEVCFVHTVATLLLSTYTYVPRDYRILFLMAAEHPCSRSRKPAATFLRPSLRKIPTTSHPGMQRTFGTLAGSLGRPAFLPLSSDLRSCEPPASIQTARSCARKDHAVYREANVGQSAPFTVTEGMVNLHPRPGSRSGSTSMRSCERDRFDPLAEMQRCVYGLCCRT